MSIRKLIIEPHPLLHQKATPITAFNDDLKTLAQDMKETMVKENGVGLAAPQIGQLVRVFVVAHKDGARVFINPEIIKKSFRTNVDEEGCLSIPGVFGPVRRHTSVTLQYYDEHGVLYKEKVDGFYARVIQHEYDHLEGILFTEKLAQ